MIKDGIYNLKSIAFTKDFYKFSNSNKFDSEYKIMRFKSSEYDLEESEISFNTFSKVTFHIPIKNPDVLSDFKIKIKHSIFKFYLEKYKITNKYIVSNIEEFYSTTKYFIKAWNDKNYGNNEKLIHLNHDSVFYILKHYETELYDIEYYKKSKLKDIFDDELVYQLKQF